VRAQGYGSPIRMQGIDHRTAASAASRGAGGISLGLMSDPSLMFANPTSLQAIQGIHLALGGGRTSRTLDQDQQWLPLRNFPTFSLMMEGLIDQIDDPDLTEPPPEGLGPEDSIPRPYDLIKPNWSLQEPERTSVQGFVAAPFEIGTVKVVGGVGAVQYANLDYYFQNNNVLTPSIGTQRPVGVPLPAIGQVIAVDWTQYLQQRRGSIMGYGGAVSVGITEELSVGASGLLLDGQSDDVELTVGRGLIRFGNNNNVFYHTLDSVYSHTTSVVRSDFSGYEVSLGAQYRGPRLSLSLTVRPPSVIERTFSGSVERDTTGTPASQAVSGSDEMLLPWRGAAGISFAVRDDLMFAFEYELRPLASAEYTDPSGQASNPWLSSSVFRLGAECVPTPWLALRLGFREEAEVFAQEGAALIGEAVRSSVYCFGLGISFAGARVNAAYEYSHLNYQDTWQSNVNINTIQQHCVVADISYVIR